MNARRGSGKILTVGGFCRLGGKSDLVWAVGAGVTEGGAAFAAIHGIFHKTPSHSCLPHRLRVIHMRNEADVRSVSAVKKAPIDTKIVMEITAGARTIDRAANAVIMVPKLPASRQLLCAHRHLDRIPQGHAAPEKVR